MGFGVSPNAAGLLRTSCRPTPGVLAAHGRTGRADMRCGHDGDCRCSGALFGARSGRVGGTHSTGCRARFCRLSSRGRRPPCLLRLLRPERHFGDAARCHFGDSRRMVGCCETRLIGADLICTCAGRAHPLHLTGRGQFPLDWLSFPQWGHRHKRTVQNWNDMGANDLRSLNLPDPGSSGPRIFPILSPTSRPGWTG